jgi:hypothetical protein
LQTQVTKACTLASNAAACKSLSLISWWASFVWAPADSKQLWALERARVICIFRASLQLPCKFGDDSLRKKRRSPQQKHKLARRSWVGLPEHRNYKLLVPRSVLLLSGWRRLPQRMNLPALELQSWTWHPVGVYGPAGPAEKTRNMDEEQ